METKSKEWKSGNYQAIRSYRLTSKLKSIPTHRRSSPHPPTSASNNPQPPHKKNAKISTQGRVYT